MERTPGLQSIGRPRVDCVRSLGYCYLVEGIHGGIIASILPSSAGWGHFANIRRRSAFCKLSGRSLTMALFRKTDRLILRIWLAAMMLIGVVSPLYIHKQHAIVLSVICLIALAVMLFEAVRRRAR